MSDSETDTEPIAPTPAKKTMPVKALEALAKAREARKKIKDAEIATKKTQEKEMKIKKEEAVKAISAIRKPKEPMPVIVEKDSPETLAKLAELEHKLNTIAKKKKVVVVEESSSEEEEVVVKRVKKVKTVVPVAVNPIEDPEFIAFKADKEQREKKATASSNEAQLRLDMKKMFSRY